MVYEDTKLLAEFSFNCRDEQKVSSSVPSQIALSVTRVFLNDGVVFGFCKEDILSKDDCCGLSSEFDKMLKGESSNEGEELKDVNEWNEETELSEEQQLMMQMGLPVSFAGTEFFGTGSAKPKRHGIDEISCVDKKSWAAKSNIALSNSGDKGAGKNKENNDGKGESNTSKVSAKFKHSMIYCVNNLVSEKRNRTTRTNRVEPHVEKCPTLEKKALEEGPVRDGENSNIKNEGKTYKRLVEQFNGKFADFWELHGSYILKQQLTSTGDCNSLSSNADSILPETELSSTHDQKVKMKRAEIEVYWEVYNYYNECSQSHSFQVNNASEENDDNKSDTADEREEQETTTYGNAVSEVLSPEKKFELFQNNMLDCLTALRCNWVNREMGSSKFKSVHIKVSNNEAKKKAQKRKKKNAKNFIIESFDNLENDAVVSRGENEDETEFSSFSESSGNENTKKGKCEKSERFDQKNVEVLGFEEKEGPGTSATNPKTLPGFNSNTTKVQKTVFATDIPSPHSVACYPAKYLENSATLDRETFKKLEKYWCQRFRLFSKFDHGCLLDQESWFSITPEKIAQHHGDRCRGDVILDAFCGSGGNSIQLGRTCEHVIGVDIDPAKLAIAKHNSNIYGVQNRIDFLLSDFLLLQPFSIDCVFLSPPWGGPTYSNSEVFDCETMMTPPLSKLMTHARQFSPNIAVLLPKNIDVQQILNDYTLVGEYVEVEQNFLSNKLKTITVYFNDLVYFG